MPQPLPPAKRRTLPAPDPGRLERHTPFLDVLGRVRARTPRWDRCRAGLLLLELLDRVWSTRRRSATIGQQRRMTVRRAIAKVRPKTTRVVLDRVLHHIAPGAGPQPEVLQALMDYAKRLQYESEFRLACHVCTMVIDYATQIGHVALLPEAYEYQGNCLRDLAMARDAMESYATGLAIAIRHRNKRGRLRLAIAQANLHRALGDSDAARKLLDPLLQRARNFGDPELLMRAAHVRGLTARDLDKRKDALVFFAEAFRNCHDLRDCGRLLNDIALVFVELGLVREAQEMWRISSQSKRGDSFARWAAMVNLLMLAHRRRDETVFDQYRLVLDRAPMPARLLVAYWREVGDGSTVFGRFAEATVAYGRAATFASRYGFVEEGKELHRVLHGHPPEPTKIPAPPAHLPAAAMDLLEQVRAQRSLPALLARASRGVTSTTSVTPIRTALKRGRRPRANIS